MNRFSEFLSAKNLKVVTPDLKTPGCSHLLLIKPAVGKFRLGGTALAQAYAQIGLESPDCTEDDVERFVFAFNAIQKCIKG